MNVTDTAFVLLCASMVMLMTPALALFYGGLVRSRNVLSTHMHSYASLGVIVGLLTVAIVASVIVKKRGAKQAQA